MSLNNNRSFIIPYGFHTFLVICKQNLAFQFHKFNILLVAFMLMLFFGRFKMSQYQGIINK